jgi:ATP-binding cassette, subfamily B (MDR/TAP), member 1
MGEGTIVEHGTHDELLRNEDSVYTHLVRAQKLREDQPDARSSQSVSKDDLVEEGPGDKVLGRRETFGNENLTRAAMDHSVKEGQKADYSLLYLFRRMGRLNRDVSLDYLLGGIFATCRSQLFLCSLDSNAFAVSGLVQPAFAIVWGQ